MTVEKPTRTTSAAKGTRTTKKAGASTTTRKKSTTSKATSRSAPSRRTSSGGKLVIVESPAKARTIERYLGRGYNVRASMGHVRDLPKSKMGIEVDDDFTPTYRVPNDKLKTVKELKDLVKGASEVILATDPDREGEAIAWHLIQATLPEGGNVSRVVFHEITPDAVRNAMQNPRSIDMDLVDAQQARRVLDRLVGYSISPLLWKKVKRGLSAGRVQSVALRLVVEREREIQEFVPREYWSLDAELAQQNQQSKKLQSFLAGLSKIRGEKAELPNAWVTDEVVRGLDGAQYVVADVQTKETQRRPAAPFITSTLQQEASRKLNYPVRRTMQIAQELYEGVDLGPEGTQGLITYMRTDSTNIAASAQAQARTAIARIYGDQFVPERPPVYTRKAKGAQEAHEAIRPTDPNRHPDSLKSVLSAQQLRVYRLIWQRFIASQMRNAIFDSTGVDIDAGPADGEKPYRFRATGSVIKFQGFLAVYREGRDDDEVDEMDKDALPQLTAGEILDLVKLIPEQHFTQPPPRFTEATLVKALEENGIGRPSTYAPTIATLAARNYVTAEQRRLVPTELGFVVSDILVEHFPSIVDIGFTSEMEEELDEIASGERKWVPVIREFYGPFSESIGKAEQTMERVKVRDEPSDEICDLCGRQMVIKLGKYGRFLACPGFPECRGTKQLLTKIGVTCPKCHEGDIVERRTKKGRVFYGCSRYKTDDPTGCDFSAWSKPTGENCPVCGGAMLVFGKAGTEAKCQDCDHRQPIRPSGVRESIPA
ncbi:MAG TPA: type I DNA topoisomerase [Thermomicrobiales bacterium]|nr:type I DNA topoisomerase [Thermomicrobiales bacterium]